MPAETRIPVVTAPGTACSRALIPVEKEVGEPTGPAFLPEKHRFTKILDSQSGLIPPHPQRPWEGTRHGLRPPKVPSKGDETQVTLDGEEVGINGQGERNT